MPLKLYLSKKVISIILKTLYKFLNLTLLYFLFTFPPVNVTLQIAFAELQRKTLQLVVYDFDRLKKDDRIGQLSIPLEKIDFGITVEEWSRLNPPEHEANSVCLEF